LRSRGDHFQSILILKRSEAMMDNPIPSAMVYFDEKERKAVLCLDGGGALHSPCTNSDSESGFHSHAWLKRGWTTETAFMASSGYPRDFAANIVYGMMFSVIKIRDDFDRMQHERDEVRKTNERLSKIIRGLTGVLNNSIPYIESEKVRLKMFKAISEAQRHVLTDEDGKGN
jgi:hypothetical protein